MARNGDAVGADAETELIAIGVASRRGDIIDIHHKRAMALEDVVVFLQIFDHSHQCRMYFREGGFVIVQVTDRDVVLLRLDIQQAVDGDAEIVASHIIIVDGDADVFLLLRRVAEQCFHLFSQKPVVFDADGHDCHEKTNDQCPIQEDKENGECDGEFEDIGEHEEVADGYKQYQPKHRTSFVPDAPRFDATK